MLNPSHTSHIFTHCLSRVDAHQYMYGCTIRNRSTRDLQNVTFNKRLKMLIGFLITVWVGNILYDDLMKREVRVRQAHLIILHLVATGKIGLQPT